jgi:hypothetical protein
MELQMALVTVLSSCIQRFKDTRLRLDADLEREAQRGAKNEKELLGNGGANGTEKGEVLVGAGVYGGVAIRIVPPPCQILWLILLRVRLHCIRRDLYHHLASVRTLKQVQEGLRSTLQTFHDSLAYLDLALRHPGTELLECLREARGPRRAAHDDEALLLDALGNEHPIQPVVHTQSVFKRGRHCNLKSSLDWWSYRGPATVLVFSSL